MGLITMPTAWRSKARQRLHGSRNTPTRGTINSNAYTTDLLLLDGDLIVKPEAGDEILFG
jgi:hypothetical protein